MANKKIQDNENLLQVRFENNLPVSNADADPLLMENIQSLMSLGIRLPRIRITTSGEFEYVSDEMSERFEEFEAKVIHFHVMNMYWATGYKANEIRPPDCISYDGITSIDGKNCRTCEYNQFGSDPITGKGKACKNVIRLFLKVTDEHVLPTILCIPPASINAFMKYTTGTLFVRGKSIQSVVTRFTATLEEYPRIKFSVVRDLTPEEYEQIIKEKSVVEQLLAEPVISEFGEEEI
ncbi:MAG: hypothetical protein ACTSRP_01935 [Candidatus Helarchaeota archaeon]